MTPPLSREDQYDITFKRLTPRGEGFCRAAISSRILQSILFLCWDRKSLLKGRLDTYSHKFVTRDEGFTFAQPLFQPRGWPHPTAPLPRSCYFAGVPSPRTFPSCAPPTPPSRETELSRALGVAPDGWCFLCVVRVSYVTSSISLRLTCTSKTFTVIEVTSSDMCVYLCWPYSAEGAFDHW